MKKKNINFKDKKYILPLILLPFILLIAYLISDFVEVEEKKEETQAELSTSLGEVHEEILSKNDAYEKFYRTRENRTMISNVDKEEDTLKFYTETLNQKQKRFIDSVSFEHENKKKNITPSNSFEKYYKAPRNNSKGKKQQKKLREEESSYQRELEILELLSSDANSTQNTQENQEEENPIKIMREQMLFMDSIERTRNPEFQQQMKIAQKLKEDRAKKEEFLNSTVDVRKNHLGAKFNHVSRKKTSNLIKAVIDENIKGYLGSRIRLRLLEDVFVGDTKMERGTILYALITGFTLQRVNLNIVSVILEGEIYPVNLSIYDNDGIKGLYVPRSAFREMMKEIGSNTNYLQGSFMDNRNQNFYSSLATGIVNSASKTIAKVIRSNKVRLKYNTYIYLVDEKQLKNRKK